MIPILFLFASILWRIIFWMSIGYVLFSLVNAIGILLVVYFAEREGNFYGSHDPRGNALLTGVGLGHFIVFIKTSKRLKRL